MSVMDQDRSDMELIQSYLSGDAASFDMLYSRYKNQLYSYLNRLLNGERACADDIFQQTWLNIIRTLPTLVIAKFAALIFGLGTFAGTVAITVFTFGVVAKMMYEAIETIDMGAFEAMESAGANKFQAFWSACFPQILPTYLSYCLYSLEMNIRAAAILGYVGAGGLGLLINERIGWRDYEGLGMVLLALFVVVFIIENTSQYLRRKLS